MKKKEIEDIKICEYCGEMMPSVRLRGAGLCCDDCEFEGNSVMEDEKFRNVL